MLSFRHFPLSLSFLLGAATALQAQTAADGPPPNGATAANPSSNTVTLEKFVVSADLDQAREALVPSLGATEFTLTPLQIDALPGGVSAGFNQVLLRTPGMAQDSFGQVHLRGEHANLQYRIDDVLLPEGISGFGQELDPAFVQSVNLVTGSLPAQYGFRTAGVVDIHTKSGDQLGHSANLAVYGGSYDTLRTSLSGSGVAGPLSGFATASFESNDLGIENPTPGRTALHDHTDQYRAFAEISRILSQTSRLTALLSASISSFQIPDNPGQTPAFALAGVSGFASAGLNERQDEVNDYAVLAYQHSSGAAGFQVSAFTRYSLVKFEPDWPGDLLFDGVASGVRRAVFANGAEADAEWPLGSVHTLRAGALVTVSDAKTATANAVFPVDDSGNQNSTTPVLIADNAHKLGTLAGLYLQDEWKPAPGFTINYGLRADRSMAYLDEGQLSPRLNVVWKAAETTTFHAGYARYFTPPPLELVHSRDIALFQGTTLEPEVDASSPVTSERAHYFDAGITQIFSAHWTATLDGYYKRASNQIDEGQFGPALIFSPFNYRTGHIKGAELTANYTNGGLTAYGNLAVARATGQQIVSGEFQFGQDELDYIASHEIHLDHDQTYTASAGASYRFGGNLLYVDLLYGSGLRRGFANSDHLPEYHPVSIGAEHVFALSGHHQLAVRLDAANVFDEVYELRDGTGIGVGAPQYGARRGFYGTISYAY